MNGGFGNAKWMAARAGREDIASEGRSSAGERGEGWEAEDGG